RARPEAQEGQVGWPAVRKETAMRDRRALDALPGHDPAGFALDTTGPMSEYYIPVVVERTGRGERSWDIYSRLLEDRIIFIGAPITDGLANSVIAQLLYLQKADKTRDIHVYVNSPGGSVSAGLAIYDTMQYVSCPVETVC